MIFTHNHRIDLNDKKVVQSLITSGQLVPTNERVSGLTGQVYAPTPGLAAQLRPLDHRTLAVGSQRLTVELHRMPEAELVALQDHPNATDFRQYDVAHLLPLLLRSRTKADEKTFVEGIIAALQVGPQRRVPALVDDIWSGSTWLPEASRVVVEKGLPFLMLAFDVPVSRPDDVDTVRCAAGLDIGLSPVTTVATASGYVNSGGSVYPVTRAEYGAICRAAVKLGIDSEVVKQVLLLLTYAAARAHLEFVTLCLQELASVVHVERIDYNSFSSDFAARGRELATIDFLSGWLAQRMHACQIAVHRVEPGYTSQVCSYCHLLGTRDGAMFTCGQCRTEVDAHANAARVILASGMASTLRRLHGRY
ncbi:transposase (plasmid) [Deinococcus sp. KNUC1210]|uniref:transposase n=1 Tax=Deinococcus sp. KNUC1210 TaxID=2917691 RepID=UPI001EF127AC|nr:transposase [Deinococcus sp. KNUC1210]ULH17865.1 transposase [Deinococcus sp. KNUC1210]